MNKQKIFAVLSALSVGAAALLPATLSFTAVPVFAAGDINAAAYIVTDAKTGNVIMAENENARRIPGSLTKLVTAMVVMDTHPKLTKQVAITSYDQTIGHCYSDGGCIKAKSGVKFSVNDLFYSALLPSANNAAAALAQSTGLSQARFAARMNAKVKALGVTNSHFVEPTGMSESNYTTAADYAKIVKAAFQYPYLRQVAQTEYFDVRSGNNSAYNQTIHNQDKLLTDNNFTVLGGKDGYIGSVSGYNWAAEIKTSSGQQISLVVLGEPHMYIAYSDAQTMVGLANEISLALR